MSGQSVLEREITDKLRSIGKSIAYRDRFVVVTFLMALVPFPTAPLLAILLSVVQLVYVRQGKLSAAEKPLLVASFVLAVLNLAATTLVVSYLERIGAGGKLLVFVQESKFLPIYWINYLVTWITGALGLPDQSIEKITRHTVENL